MKCEYPDYRETGTFFIRNKLTTRDQKILDNFKEYVGIRAGQKRIELIERYILQFYDVTEVSFDKITLEILRRFLYLLNKSDRLTETKNDIKKSVKRFLRWRYEDWDKRFDSFNDIKTTDGINHQKINSSTLLTPDEIRIIVNKIESLKYKSLILLMFESAGRPEEIVKLKWKDIFFKSKQVALYSSKTRKTRVNPVNESIGQLKRYRDECFYPSACEEDFVFPKSKDRQSHITVTSLWAFFQNLGKNLNFKKHIFPYLLRHTRLTQVHKKLSPKAYEKFAGHSIEIGTKRYAHLDSDDVKEEMLKKIYQIEDIDNPDKMKIENLENQIKRLEKTIFMIIDKTNLVYDAVAFPE
jgi:integrase